jgi:diaminopropionate ammonia-lyase
MSTLGPSLPVNHLHNAHAAVGVAYGARQRAILDAESCAAAWREITSWEGYAPTPLLDLRGLAGQAGLQRLWYKQESGRFGLGSFKALGGAYAVARILMGEIHRRTGATVSTADLSAGRYGDIVGEVTVTCATDGNHGRSVAWGARRFGCACVIYIHATVSDARKQAIERYGAQVVRTRGNYDDSVREAALDAEQQGRVVVSDTSYPGYMEIPRYVMQGYTVLAQECIQQLSGEGVPTHLFLQGGVGGFAAAVVASFWMDRGSERPRMVVVEPDRAACIHASVEAGRPTAVHGDLDTLMAGLACGEVSLLAWEILDQGTDDILTVTDEAAMQCMHLLADGVGVDAGLVAGESAVAGLAGALLARQDSALAATLALGPDSRVLVIGTEGATDPELYRQLVGRDTGEIDSP